MADNGNMAWLDSELYHLGPVIFCNHNGGKDSDKAGALKKWSGCYIQTVFTFLYKSVMDSFQIHRSELSGSLSEKNVWYQQDRA